MGQRSKVTQLPREVREWLDSALIEGNFSGYEALEEELKRRGIAIGKSSIHRYGTNLERRLQAIRASTEAAAAIAKAAPDDEDHRSGAVLSLIQTEIFETIMQLQEAEDADPTERVKLLSAAAKNIATMTRASVTLKRWQSEWRAKFAKDLARIETEAKADKLSPTEVIRRIRVAYGLDQSAPAPSA